MMIQAVNVAGPRTQANCFNERFLDETYQMICDGQVGVAMDDLLAVLRALKLRSTPPEWAQAVQMCLQHPLRELLHQDPFTSRAFSKPRGYAGDAVLLDFVYGHEERWALPPETTELGAKIFEYTTQSAACDGVRARRGFIADMIDRLSTETHQPDVLSIAAGHLREALLCASVKRRRLGRYVALDWDRESLEEVERCYGPYGVESAHANIRQLLTQKVDLGRFDLVYSTGLYDYLQPAAGQRLTWAMFEMLRPRGRLLVANFLPAVPDLGYMETYMDWQLIYRTRRDMLDLSMSIPQKDIRHIRLFAEENQNILFLEITKR